MRKIAFVFLSVFVATSAMADSPRDGRVGATQRGRVSQFAPRAPQKMPSVPTGSVQMVKDIADTTVSVPVVDNVEPVVNTGKTTSVDEVRAADVVPKKPAGVEPEQKDMRETEKMNCIANNIGIGNTFVWASRFSNTDLYSQMVEDVDNPENNTCFVKVEIKSDDQNVDVSDISAKYFEIGQTIECGSWADEAALEKRILDAKKSKRTLATVGGALGGGGLGVGVMELFGNRLIGGAVEGQKGLDDVELLESQLNVLAKTDQKAVDVFKEDLKQLKEQCDKITSGPKPKECNENHVYMKLARKI